MCFVLQDPMLRAPMANATVALKVGVEKSAKRRDAPVCSTRIARDVALVTALLRRVTAIQDGLGGDVMSQLVQEPQCAAAMERVRPLQPHRSVLVIRDGWVGLAKPNVIMALLRKQPMDPSFASVMTATVV